MKTTCGSAEAELTPQEEIVYDILIRRECKILENGLDAVGARCVRGRERSPPFTAMKSKLTRVRLNGPAKHLHDRRLARTVVAYDCDDFTGSDCEIDGFDGRN